MNQGSLSEIDNLLQSLGVAKKTPVNVAPPTPVAPTRPAAPTPTPTPQAAVTVEAKTETPPAANPPPASNRPGYTGKNQYYPVQPQSLKETGLEGPDVSDLILKFLAKRGTEAGYSISAQLGLSLKIIEEMLRDLKLDRLAHYKNSIAGGDYMYELTDLGLERAKSLSEQCTYFGTAPVPLSQYIDSVTAQTISGRKPTLDEIGEAFSDMAISEHMLSNVGQAIHSGAGMFLYGPPGNGKTSMAERVTRSFGDNIWIPRTIVAGGEILRMFDPNRHKPVPVPAALLDVHDNRWVLVERPTIVAGGELQMENLEVTYIRSNGIGEAPLQLKANCGTLLIDDFGRQKMSTDELLNRWIVPLEQRHDFLHLESGRMIQVPFDELIIFSTNLEPRDLADDAFLRRIPYKIEVKDPSEEVYRNLFQQMITKAGFTYTQEAVDHMIQKHYVDANRPFRYCQPRDLIRQMENRCTLHDYPKEMTKEAIDQAVENYFSIM